MTVITLKFIEALSYITCEALYLLHDGIGGIYCDRVHTFFCCLYLNNVSVDVLTDFESLLSDKYAK